MTILMTLQILAVHFGHGPEATLCLLVTVKQSIIHM